MKWIAGRETAIWYIVAMVLLSGVIGFEAGRGHGFDRGYAEATDESEQRIERELGKTLAASERAEDLAERLDQCIAASQASSRQPETPVARAKPPVTQPDAPATQHKPPVAQRSQPSSRRWGVLWEKDSLTATCPDRVEYVPYLYTGGPRGRRWDKLQCEDDICHIIGRDIGQHEVWLEMLKLAKGWPDDEVIALGAVQVVGEKQIYICED